MTLSLSTPALPPVLPPFPPITVAFVMLPSPSPHCHPPPCARRGRRGRRGDDTCSPGSASPRRRTCLHSHPCGPLRHPRSVSRPPRRYPHPFLRPHHLCPRPRLPRPFPLVTVILVSTCPHHFLHRPRRPLSLLSACLAMALAVPQMPESTLDGTLETWQKKVADTESKDCHHRDRRLTYFVYAPAEGRITEWLANEEKCRSGCDLCIPGVKRTVLVEDEATARVCRSSNRAVVQILYADAWCPFTRVCCTYSTTIHQ